MTRPDAASAPEPKEPHRSQFRRPRLRTKTAFEDEHIAARTFSHKYLIRRPRALQARYQGQVIKAGDHGHIDVEDLKSSNESRSTSQTGTQNQLHREKSNDSQNVSERSTDDVVSQRERLDLFIDLLWVGVISNISEYYFDQVFGSDSSTGIAFMSFVILFLPAWSIWSHLREFLNQYYMDDLLQRVVILWVLVLAMAWGNNAPYLIDPDGSADFKLLAIYLVAIVSMKMTELVYSIWMPWLRRAFLVRFILGLPLFGLWIALSNVAGWTQIGLLWAAIILNQVVDFVEASPIGDRMIGNRLRKHHNEEHAIQRYENFFIITLGEGVFLLIKGSPLGRGISIQLGRGILGLLMYYALYSLYLNGDQSRKFVHPVYRRWWIREFYFLIHVPIYMALVILSSSVLYLIDYEPTGETNGLSGGETGFLGEKRQVNTSTGSGPAQTQDVSVSSSTLQTAIATCYISLAVILYLQCCLAVLVRTLDKPKILLVNNRYVRLLPRFLAVILFATLWLVSFSDPTLSLGVTVLILYLLVLWEWVAGLESGAKIIEPSIKSGSEGGNG